MHKTLQPGIIRSAAEHPVILQMHRLVEKDKYFISRCQSGTYVLNFNLPKDNVTGKFFNSVTNDYIGSRTGIIIDLMHQAIDTDKDMIMMSESGQYALKFDTPGYLMRVSDTHEFIATGEQTVQGEFLEVRTRQGR